MTVSCEHGTRKRDVRPGYHVALFALLLLMSSCKKHGSEEKKQSEPTTERVPQHADTSSGKEAEQKGKTAQGEVSELKAQELVQSWVHAQNSGAFSDYAKLYAERMHGTKRVGTREAVFDRQGWLADREKMFAGPFTVEVGDLTVTLAGGVAVARFQQTWSNARFRDVGPKQLVISLEADGLRISREEMLSSDVGEKKSAGELAPKDLALVRTSGKELRLLLVKKPQLNWITGSAKMSPGGASIRSVDAQLVSEPERALLTQRFELFDEKGQRCEATAVAFEVLIDVVPHFGMVNAWEGRYEGQEQPGAVASAQQRAMDLWEMSSDRGRFLALNLKPVSDQVTPSACEKPIWGRVVRDGAQVWSVRNATESEAKKLGAAAQKESDYLSEFKGTGQSPNSDMVQSVRLFEHADGRKYAVAQLLAPGERCGQTEMLHHWVVLRVVGSGASVVSNGDLGNTEAPLGAVEVPGLTEPVFVSSNYMFRQSSLDGLFYRFVEQSAENFDCGC